MTTTYDWERFSISFYYSVSPEKLFRAWATSAGLERFFIKSAKTTDSTGAERAPNETCQSGDKYHWVFRHDFQLDGEFREVIDNERLVFTFGSMIVTLTIKPAGDQTLLYLEQTEIPTDEASKPTSHMNCRSCWLFFLTNLKSVLEHGIDLRDSSPDRVSSMEVGYVPKEL